MQTEHWYYDWCKQSTINCDWYKQNTVVLWLIQTEHWYYDWYKQNTGAVTGPKGAVVLLTDANRTLVLWPIQAENTGIVTDVKQKTNKQKPLALCMTGANTKHSIVIGTNRTLALWWYKQNISIVIGKNTSIVTGANRTLALWLVQTEH